MCCLGKTLNNYFNPYRACLSPGEKADRHERIMYTAGTVGTSIFTIGLILGTLFLQHLLPGDKIALAYYVLPTSGIAAVLLILGIHQGYSSLKIRHALDKDQPQEG